MIKELFGLLLVVVFISACTPTQDVTSGEDVNQDIVVEQKPVDTTLPPILLSKEERMKNAAETVGYVGTPLAGEKTFYIRFNMADYDFAVSKGKLIFINFYSTECAYCQDDNAAALNAFDSMNYENVVGFRALFNDPASTLDDKDIALKYGVDGPNTKVIVRDGKRVFKATDSWNKQTFIDEITRNIG
jgi:thiol-disulfide isomerase/thioredoxin